jgi:hypothetical protein
MSTPQTTEIAGVVFNRSLAMDGQALTLNGAGLRSLLMVKVYVAALYVPQPSRRAEDILAAGGPLAIELVMKRSVGVDTILDNFHGTLRDNVSAAEWAQLAPAIAGLDAAIHAVKQTREGDRLRLEFTADGDTRIVFNGTLLQTVTGGGLAAAMPLIWLGKKPAQESVKKGMLGG